MIAGKEEGFALSIQQNEGQAGSRVGCENKDDAVMCKKGGVLK